MSRSARGQRKGQTDPRSTLGLRPHQLWGGTHPQEYIAEVGQVKDSWHK